MPGRAMAATIGRKNSSKGAGLNRVNCTVSGGLNWTRRIATGAAPPSNIPVGANWPTIPMTSWAVQEIPGTALLGLGSSCRPRL